MKIFNRNIRIRKVKRKLEEKGILYTVYDAQTDFLGWAAGIGVILLTGMVISLALMGAKEAFFYF